VRFGHWYRHSIKSYSIWMEMNKLRRKLVLPHLYLTLLTREGNSDGDGFMFGLAVARRQHYFCIITLSRYTIIYFSLKGAMFRWKVCLFILPNWLGFLLQVLCPVFGTRCGLGERASSGADMICQGWCAFACAWMWYVAVHHLQLTLGGVRTHPQVHGGAFSISLIGFSVGQGYFLLRT